MVKKLKSEPVDKLFEAILTLQTKDECYSFFEDLCTVNELLSLSQRFEVATMLREKKTYLFSLHVWMTPKGQIYCTRITPTKH